MEDFFIYLLKSAGLLATFLGCYYLLLKKDTSFITNRIFLLGGLVTSAILPTIYFTKTVIIKAQPTQFQFTETTVPVTEIVIQDPTVSPLEIFAGIYILGVIVMFIRLLLQLFSLSRILFSGKFFRKEDAIFIETTRNIAPFSFLNYIVYNPSLHFEKELKYILKHEKTHVKQRHTIDILLAHLNLIYQWFNPLAWLYLNSIQQNLEFIADREAVKKATCKKEYQNALVKISVGNSNLALTNNFYQSLIKKRIVMLNKSSSNKYSTWKTVFIVPALFAFIFFFNIKTVAQIQSEEKDKVEEKAKVEENGYRNFTISFQILNTSTEEHINTVIKGMEKFNVQFDFNNIKRNEAGLITEITASYLDKNNNSSGSITRQNEDGIKGFEFYYSEKDGSGFRSPNTAVSDVHGLLRNLGNQPLVILEGKNYNISQLEGKRIRILGEVSVVPSSEAIKTYGNAAKDGALIITKGKLIEDYYAEIKKLDLKDENAVHDFIKFKKGEKPSIISLHKNLNAGASQKENNNSGSGSSINLKDLNIPGKNPIYILDGKVVKLSASEIDTNNLTSMMVLKGASAVSVYGKEAKDGAVIMTTRNPSDTSAYTYTFTADSLIYINASQNVNRQIYASKTGGDVYTKVGQNGFYLASRDSTLKPLYIVDGKEMDKDYKAADINTEQIRGVSVYHSTDAKEKYGEKGKDGVIEITTSKGENVLPFEKGSYEVVKSTATDKELKEAKSKIKKETGMEVDFLEVKRNNDGVITAIKISAKHRGEHINYTATETDGINDIYIGKVNNKIRITSQR